MRLYASQQCYRCHNSTAPLFVSRAYPGAGRWRRTPRVCRLKLFVPQCSAGHKSKLDDEAWQRERRAESAELKRLRDLEDAEEARRTENYRLFSSRLENHPPEEVKEAKALVASFIRSGEEIEKRIEEAADAGKLSELVLLVIRNRLELARHDVHDNQDERHVIQALNLLYRRIEAEMMRRTASPAMCFLNDLLNLYDDGCNREEWLRKCRWSMVNTFPAEDAFTLLTPQGVDLRYQQGPIDFSAAQDNILLRVDFIREVDSLLAELDSQSRTKAVEGMDPQSVALRLSQQRKQNAIQQVKDLQRLAINLQW